MTEAKFTKPEDAEEDHEWETRCGYPAKLVYTFKDKRKFASYLFIVTTNDGEEKVWWYKGCGTLYPMTHSKFNLRDKPKHKDVWVITFPSLRVDGMVVVIGTYLSEKDAEKKVKELERFMVPKSIYTISKVTTRIS